MFFAISEATGKRVFAGKAVYSNSGYFCPICKETLVLKRGDIKTPHFAHKGNSNCDRLYSSPNSVSRWVLDWEESFPEDNREILISDEKEKHFADILINDRIINFQHSPISSDIFMARTRFFAKHCKTLFWVFE